jgi:hypothetical protein
MTNGMRKKRKEEKTRSEIISELGLPKEIVADINITKQKSANKLLS